MTNNSDSGLSLAPFSEGAFFVRWFARIALCKSPSEERLRFDEPLGLSKQHKRYSFGKSNRKSDKVGLL